MFSKSKGNGVDPLDIINQGYGADALRTYLMFASPLELWTRWDPHGVPGVYRFLSRIWNLVQDYQEAKPVALGEEQAKAMRHATHQTIKKMTDDLEANRYNTAIAAAMGFVNDLYKFKTTSFGKHDVWQEALEAIVAGVAPFAPHIADELWLQLGHSASVQRDSWPKYDEKYLVTDMITIAVQVNGKVRAELEVAKDITEADAVAAAQANERVQAFTAGKPIKKSIYVPGRLVNLVV
jgi:leucyl-tRNA synthetase